MKHQSSALLIVLLCILVLLVNCKSRANENLPHTEFSQRYMPLRVDTVDGLAEIYAWKILKNGEAISHIQHNLDLNRLTVISEPTQKVVLFAIEGEETIAHQTVDIPNLRVLGIDEEGEKLLVGRSGERLNDHGKPQEYFHWIGLWNILSELLDQCFTWPCTGGLTDPDQIAYAYIGAVIDNKTEITYSEGSYLTTILSSKNGGGVALVNSPDVDYLWHTGRIAVNSDQNRLAIVFQEGGITLRKISEPHSWWPLTWTDVLAEGEENQLQHIEEAIFDPSGKWLVIVRGRNLIIWQVNGWKREVFQEQVGNVHGIRFNPSGELLFVGRDNAVSVLNLKERSFGFEIQAPDITSLDISDDNRLLFWGDKNGTVHVWGIPVSK